MSGPAKSTPGIDTHRSGVVVQIFASRTIAKGREVSLGSVALGEAPGPPRARHAPQASSRASSDRGRQALQVALGKAIRGRRNELRLSRPQLAKRLAKREAWLARVEDGKINPAYTTIAQVAYALGLAPSGLISLAEMA